MDLDPTIYGRLQLLWEWYNWGVFVAFVLGLGAVFWVFFDSQRRGHESVLWKIVAVVSLILILPSVLLRIDPSLGFDIPDAIEPLGFLGLLAAVAAVITLFAYSLGVAVAPATRTCPRCGATLDPSWDHCPYCVPQASVTYQDQQHVAAQVAGLPSNEYDYPVQYPAQGGMGVDLPTGQQFWQGQPTAPPQYVQPAHDMGGLNPVHTEILHKKPEKLAWLVQGSGPRAGREYALGHETNIGRDASTNDIVIDDGSVSRQHARIRLEDGRFMLYDLASSNRTYVNDQEIQKQPLLDGDTIRFGRAEFIFMDVK